MAYTNVKSEPNLPGFTVRKWDITLDGEESIANEAYTSPKYVDPLVVSCYQTVQATDGSMVKPVYSVDTANAQVDLSFDVEGGGDSSGARFTMVLLFPASADQDGEVRLMVASAGNVTQHNLPGFTVAEVDITWDAAGVTQSLADVDLSAVIPKYITPFLVSSFTVTDPSAGTTGPVDVQVVWDSANAQMDLSCSSNVNVAGAVTRITVMSSASADQDGTSVHGSGNTGKTFD